MVVLLVFVRRRCALSSAAAGFGLLAAAGSIASGAGFAFDTHASPGKRVELGNELALAVAGVTVIALGRAGVRGIAGGALGLLGLAAGAVAFPVLLHGVVLSILPATAARAMVVLTMCSAGAAIILGLVVFEDELSSTHERAEPSLCT